MGKRGPKAAPTVLKEMRGNPGRRPLNVVEPRPRSSIPRMPGWLSVGGKSAWRALAPELAKLGLLTSVDWQAFSMLCETWAAWRSALKVARGVGRMATTPNGFEQVSAAHVVERQLREDFWRGAAAFGMTPSGRSGLRVETEEREDGLRLWEEMRRKRAERKLQG